MSTTDTKLAQFVINKLTKAEYTAAAKDANQLYVCTDTGELFLGSLQIGSSNSIADLYRVGSVYITTENTETCPIASMIPGSTWSLVESGKALWSGNGANAATTISAGLPNITGKFSAFPSPDASTIGGAFYYLQGQSHHYGSGGSYSYVGGFEASRSNAIYGASDTVQPPAFVVNVWKRLT